MYAIRQPPPTAIDRKRNKVMRNMNTRPAPGSGTGIVLLRKERSYKVKKDQDTFKGTSISSSIYEVAPSLSFNFFSQMGFDRLKRIA